MPLYLYRNPDTGEVREIIQSMSDKHVYGEHGVKWDRVFTVPQATFDTVINPFDSKNFVKKTDGKGTIGDLLDRSEEWSSMRKDKEGRDEIKEKSDFNYSKKRNGRRAPGPEIKEMVI